MGLAARPCHLALAGPEKPVAGSNPVVRGIPERMQEAVGVTAPPDRRLRGTRPGLRQASGKARTG
jgi:hypothetical protein